MNVPCKRNDNRYHIIYPEQPFWLRLSEKIETSRTLLLPLEKLRSYPLLPLRALLGRICVTHLAGVAGTSDMRKVPKPASYTETERNNGAKAIEPQSENDGKLASLGL